MGWGYGLDLMKNRGTANEERRELVYWHKFDDLWNNRPFRADDDMRYEKIKMSKEDVEKLRDLVCRTPDYWTTYEGEALGTTRRTDGFSTAEIMCEIAYLYDELTRDGWEIIFQGS